MSQIKDVLKKSNLSQNNIAKVETMLRDAGADYYKILVNDAVDVKHWTQFDLILRYHGLAEDFIVYIDFD